MSVALLRKSLNEVSEIEIAQRRLDRLTSAPLPSSGRDSAHRAEELVAALTDLQTARYQSVLNGTK